MKHRSQLYLDKALRTVGIAALAVLNDQLAGETAPEQRKQVVDISEWRVHNEEKPYPEKNRAGLRFDEKDFWTMLAWEC